MHAPQVDIRRSSDRFHTRAGWLDSRHSFSFGGHYSPDNTHHGQLVVLNDDRVAGGAGFEMHPHRDMEIVTWVLEGALEHEDSEGNRGIVHPGLAQRMSAGRGIWHSERNASATDDVRFIQMWVVPDAASGDPSYEQRDVDDRLAAGGLVPIASGQGADAAIALGQRDAALWGARIQPGARIVVPEAPFGHLFVARGGVSFGGNDDLDEGDAARLTEAGTPELIAGEDGAEILIWTTGGPR